MLVQLNSGDSWLNVTNKYISGVNLEYFCVDITNKLRKPSKLKVLILGVLSKSHNRN